MSCRLSRSILRCFASSPVVTPPPLQRVYAKGDVVEYCDYSGTFCLGLVRAAEEMAPAKHLLTVVTLDDTASVKALDSYFVRFHVPAKAFDSHLGRFHVSVQAEGSDAEVLAELQRFRERATRTLNSHFRLMEKAVAIQTESWAQRPLGKENLLYEADLARTVFGPNPRPEELYAIHLYLHSYNEKFARDAAYQAGGESSVYFCRRPDDVSLFKRVQSMLVNDDAACRSFREDVKFALKRQIPLKRTPEYELFLALLLKAATCNFQDFYHNPHVEATRQLLNGIAPTTSLNDLVRLVSTLGLEAHLEEVDLVKLQSGLLFDPTRTLEHQTRTSSLMTRPVDGSSTFDGDTQFDGLALAIDSGSTVEVDDAISLQQVDGKTWLHVHVADPSKFIPLGTEADLAARSMVSTIYTAQATYPMIPWAVGAKASLDPEQRMNQCITFSASLGPDGNIEDYRVSLGVITALVRVDYEVAERDLAGTGSSDRRVQVLCGAHRLAEMHRGYRKRQGCLAFGIPRGRASFTDTRALEFHLDDSEPLARRLVAECMIIAGRVAALFANERRIPIPYRYHLPPTSKGDDATTLHTLMDRIRADGENATLYDSLCLMSHLQPSTVDVQRRPHWAMGLDGYCKATSPLRRYLDLLLHQQIRAHLTKTTTPQTTDSLGALLPSVYRHEQYLKRLMASSNRFWTLCYIRKVLRTQAHGHGHAHDGWRPLRVTALPLTYNKRNGTLQIFIPQFALRHFGPIPGGSRLALGTPYPMDIVSVDPLRQNLHVVPALEPRF